jgi:hypothetical protein
MIWPTDISMLTNLPLTKHLHLRIIQTQIYGYSCLYFSKTRTRSDMVLLFWEDKKIATVASMLVGWISMCILFETTRSPYDNCGIAKKRKSDTDVLMVVSTAWAINPRFG